MIFFLDFSFYTRRFLGAHACGLATTPLPFLLANESLQETKHAVNLRACLVSNSDLFSSAVSPIFSRPDEEPASGEKVTFMATSLAEQLSVGVRLRTGAVVSFFFAASAAAAVSQHSTPWLRAFFLIFVLFYVFLGANGALFVVLGGVGSVGRRRSRRQRPKGRLHRRYANER